MVQPAPLMMSAPVKKSAVVETTSKGDAIAVGAASRVENMQGKKR